MYNLTKYFYFKVKQEDKNKIIQDILNIFLNSNLNLSHSPLESIIFVDFVYIPRTSITVGVNGRIRGRMRSYFVVLLDARITNIPRSTNTESVYSRLRPCLFDLGI